MSNLIGLRNLRNRHYRLKIELLNLAKKIDFCDKEDISFYQELCESYAYQIKRIEKTCFSEYGIQMCQQNFKL